MKAALPHWRAFPTEIASDLSRFHGRHIREWHQGLMSSRELVDDILPHLPDTSAYKKALRGGDWSDAEYREARLVNETALARADNAGYMPELVESPLQKHVAEAVDLYRIQKHDENLARLQGKRKAVNSGDRS